MELRLPASSYLRRMQAPTPGRHCNSLFHLPLRKKLPMSDQVHSTTPSICSTKLLPYIASINGKKSFFCSSTLQNTELIAASDRPTFQRLVKFLDANWRFLRPYTIRGSIVASISWGIRAFLEKPNGVPLGLSLLQALSAVFVLICANAFVAGINQIYDIDIDKINKPYLPMAARDLSVKAAWTTVLSLTAGGLAVAVANRAQPITIALYSCIIFLGFLYSVPPFRWKRYAVGTCFIIAVGLGIIVNIGLYFALKATVSFPFQWKTPMTFICTFGFVLDVVFGLIKDLPDIEGDHQHNIITPASVLGPKKTTLLGAAIVLSIYLSTMVGSILMPESLRSCVILPARVILSVYLGFQVWLLDKANYGQEACQKFYMAIWHLFYAEYVLFPFI